MLENGEHESKEVSLSKLKSSIKGGPSQRSFRNGKMVTVTVPVHHSDPSPDRARKDSFGNLISKDKFHKVRISDSVKVIEVENWKTENGPEPLKSRCSICALM